MKFRRRRHTDFLIIEAPKLMIAIADHRIQSDIAVT
jgi:hypothetical protein